MGSSVRRDLAAVAALLLAAGAVADRTAAAPPRPEGPNMTTARILVDLSSNGAAALVVHEGDRLRLLDLPAGTPRLERPAAGVAQAALSAGGAALAILTRDGALEVHRAGDTARHAVPGGLEGVRAVAVSDAGDRLALARQTAEPGTTRVELWALPPGPAPLATVALPAPAVAAFEGDAALAVLTLQAPTTRGRGYSAGLRFDPAGPALAPFWTDDGVTPPRVPLGVFGGRTWTAEQDALLGRRPGADPVRLPGTLRDRVILSPDGARLLVHRTERTTSPTAGAVLLRLFDTRTWEELRREEHVVEQVATTAFFVGPDGVALFAARPSPETGVAIRRLSGPAPTGE